MDPPLTWSELAVGKLKLDTEYSQNTLLISIAQEGGGGARPCFHHLCLMAAYGCSSSKLV